MNTKYGTENYSKKYLELLKLAQNESASAGVAFSNQLFQAEVCDSFIDNVQRLAFEVLYPHLYGVLPAYWGNSCQILSAHVYSFLKAIGVDCEVVVGEVEINGTLEFDATLENLREEYLSESLPQGGQLIHVWVSIGEDSIVDTGLPDRIIKNYRFPENHMPPILVGRASDLSERFRARHQPLLVGAEFVGKTNQIDLEKMAEFYESLVNSPANNWLKSFASLTRTG